MYPDIIGMLSPGAPLAAPIPRTNLPERASLCIRSFPTLLRHVPRRVPMTIPIRRFGAALAASAALVLAFLAGRWSVSATSALGGSDRGGSPGAVRSAAARIPERRIDVRGGGQAGPGAPGSAEADRDALARLDLSPASEARERERMDLIARWAARDPVAALDYVRFDLRGDRRAQGLSLVFKTWARRDPRAAWGWVTRNMPGATPNLDEVIGEVGRSEPALAAELVAGWASMHPGTAQEVYLAAIRGMAYAGSFTEAAQVIEGAVIPGAGERDDLVTYLAGQWARYQPEQAAEWARQLPPGPARDQAMTSLSIAWADSDPSGAAKFAFSLPAGTSRERALEEVVSKWLTVDPAQARDWVINQGVHDDFDRAVAAIATQPQLIGSQPAVALQWAGDIIDDSVRFRCLNTVLSNLYARDPAAAAEYIRSSRDLTPDQRAEFLRRFPSP